MGLTVWFGCKAGPGWGGEESRKGCGRASSVVILLQGKQKFMQPAPSLPIRLASACVVFHFPVYYSHRSCLSSAGLTERYGVLSGELRWQRAEGLRACGRPSLTSAVYPARYSAHPSSNDARLKRRAHWRLATAVRRFPDLLICRWPPPPLPRSACWADERAVNPPSHLFLGRCIAAWSSGFYRHPQSTLELMATRPTAVLTHLINVTSTTCAHFNNTIRAFMLPKV